MNFTRRQLGGLAVGALAARAQEGERKIGYAMVGLGRISMQHLAPSLKTSKLARVTALVSGHRDKAEKMAAEYGIPAKNIYSYENYDAIAENKDIDAVYVALPNSMHAEYTIRAAKAGKHVLCEKPMATTVADAQAMIDACRKANRKLMIAYRLQFEPMTLRARELVRSGKLGKIQAIESANGFNIRAGEWRVNMKLAGGGPLMDMGVYSLNACRFVTGEEPGEYTGELERGGSGWPVQRGGRESGVEHEVSVGHGGELQYDVRGEYAGVLPGARVEGDDARGAGVRVRGAAADGADSGGAGDRRAERGEGPGTVHAGGGSPGGDHPARGRVAGFGRRGFARYEAHDGDLPVVWTPGGLRDTSGLPKESF